MQAYDQVPYQSIALPQTHPDRLAVHARLFGLEPAPVADCRVLEVGCGDGANLLPMAAAFPESTFVGIDVAEQPIARGRARAEVWDIANLDLHALDLVALSDALGPFDYVLAHGVYSWVPDTVRDGLMALLGRCLAPQGVAFVSYNALPGGHLRRMTREMMRYHIAGVEEPGKQVEQARALLDFLLDAQPEDSYYRAVLEKERELSHKYTAEHFFHDHLADANRPFYVHEFVAHAERHGLQFLAEADFTAMQDRAFPPATRAVLAQLDGDPIRKEQYLDFLRNRMFRQTLLCRAEAPLQRPPQADRIRSFTVAAPIVPEMRDETTGVVTYEGAEGNAVQTGHPFAQAVCDCIGEAWPRAVAFDDLWAAVSESADEGITADVLARMLLDFYADGFVYLHTVAPALARDVSEQPEALPVARRQAEDGAIVTNAWHRSIPLDAAERRVLPLLDGRRDRTVLLEAGATSSNGTPPLTAKSLEVMLHHFVQQALLVA